MKKNTSTKKYVLSTFVLSLLISAAFVWFTTKILPKDGLYSGWVRFVAPAIVILAIGSAIKCLLYKKGQLQMGTVVATCVALAITFPLTYVILLGEWERALAPALCSIPIALAICAKDFAQIGVWE